MFYSKVKRAGNISVKQVSVYLDTEQTKNKKNPKNTNEMSHLGN